ncbi:MAG: hypothetical protein OXI37_07315 [Gammaproteobacteria bacterium]|nr:hypothetical protein [Gammaproteobacteria bacterium]
MKLVSPAVVWLAWGICTVTTTSVAAEGVPYEKVADMLYQVMSANREVYTRGVVQCLTLDEQILTTSEHFEDDAALPLPS